MATLNPPTLSQPLPVASEKCPSCTKRFIPTPKSKKKCIFCMTVNLRMK